MMIARETQSKMNYYCNLLSHIYFNDIYVFYNNIHVIEQQKLYFMILTLEFILPAIVLTLLGVFKEDPGCQHILFPSKCNVFN